MAKEKSVEANDQKELAALRAENEALKIALSKTGKKEVSDFFFVEKTGLPMKWTNVSETKKFFEINRPEVLVELCKTLKVEMLSSAQFHQYLFGLK